MSKSVYHGCIYHGSNVLFLGVLLKPVVTDTFFFNAKNLDSDEVKDSVIQIEVQDADAIGRNDVIG